ncbi:MAG: hypothetical protein M5R36_14160 [Deltaproteobacteria bacterium]|nr:hypothetical protein [Deltaproteobacteria bacterium]
MGIREDSPETLDRLVSYVKKLDPDYPAFHPMTPVPGTQQFRDATERGWLEITDFSRFDWMTPVMGTDYMSREELDYKIWEMNKAMLSPRKIFFGLFSTHRYRRRMYVWWLLVSLRVGWDYVLGIVAPRRSTRERVALSEYVGMLRPAWYDA